METLSEIATRHPAASRVLHRHGLDFCCGGRRPFVEACRERGISTIAANVEDANTMAVLWQLGVQHLEGFLIQAPEEVVLDAAGRGRQVR